MAQLSLHITEEGWKKFASAGFKTIKYYEFGDAENIYGVTATNNLLPKVTGSHYQITDSYCGKAEYNGMFPNKPVESEILDTRTRLNVFFNNIDCANEFIQPNLSLRINLGRWFSDLGASVFSYNMSETLTQQLWKYISAKVESLDLTTNDYVPTKTVTDFKLTYSPTTNEDYMNYQLFSPKFVRNNSDGTKTLVNVGAERFPSPFLLSFVNENVNGNIVFGTGGALSLKAGNWGYWDGTIFRTISEVENSDLSLYENIFPAVMIGNEYFYVPTVSDYSTLSGGIGWMINMVSTKDSKRTALQALIEMGKLFMKANGKLQPDGNTYIISMNFNVIPTNQSINNITKIIGNNLNLEFYYNPSDILSPIIQPIIS